jgi:type IV pilus assembly protein PilN
MARINLLPWRAELRALKQKEFVTYMAFAAVVGIVVMYAFHIFMEGKISTQDSRNSFIEKEIVKVEQKILEIDKLETQRRELKKRMDLIQRLQHSRPEVVHLFDSLPRAIPDGIHLTSIVRNGNLLTINGKAESNTRISAFMRNIDSSQWLGKPDLSDIQADEKSPVPSHDFTVTVILNIPDPTEEE